MPSAAIAGTGLIGTSVALGLQSAGWAVSAWDPDEGALASAAARGAIEPMRSFDDLLETEDAVLVIAAPPDATISTLRGLHRGGLTIDVASVKAEVAAAGAHLDHFVATHPMAGREVPGPEAASVRLFHGATWVVCTDGAGSEDLARVEGLVEVLGARPVRMSAAEHDEAVARVSHLPQIVAGALMHVAAATAASLDLAAGSFRDLTRVAASDPAMWEAILDANRDEVVSAIQSLRVSLEHVERLVGDRDPHLREVLADARALRERLGSAAAPVRVALADRPGEIVRVGHGIEAAGVDVRDIQLRHAPYGGGGVLTLSVRDEDVAVLRRALIDEGLLLID